MDFNDWRMVLGAFSEPEAHDTEPNGCAVIYPFFSPITSSFIADSISVLYWRYSGSGR